MDLQQEINTLAQVNGLLQTIHVRGREDVQAMLQAMAGVQNVLEQKVVKQEGGNTNGKPKS